MPPRANARPAVREGGLCADVALGFNRGGRGRAPSPPPAAHIDSWPPRRAAEAAATTARSPPARAVAAPDPASSRVASFRNEPAPPASRPKASLHTEPASPTTATSLRRCRLARLLAVVAAASAARHQLLNAFNKTLDAESARAYPALQAILNAFKIILRQVEAMSDGAGDTTPAGGIARSGERAPRLRRARGEGLTSSAWHACSFVAAAGSDRPAPRRGKARAPVMKPATNQEPPR